MYNVSSAEKFLPDQNALRDVVMREAHRLRVLHVINRLDLGGTESGIMKVIAGLSREEFTHAVCTARGHSADFLKQHSFTGRVFDATGRNAKYKFLLPCFVRIIRQYRPHIVHSRNWGAIEAVFAARVAGTPVVIHSEHGYELDVLKGLPFRRRLFRHVAYQAADAVFTVSSDLRDYHARQAGVSPSSVDVLANGVDSQRFAPRPEAKLACRVALNLPRNSFLIGTVGRLVPIKGHALLLRAAEILVERGLDITVALAGAGSELESLRSIAESSRLAGRVHFLGAARDVDAFLNALDAFVLPSISEGMSNTLLEAMSSGLPVIATRVGGNTELVKSGVSGLLFPVGDVKELVWHLSALTESEDFRKALGAAARSRVLAEYRLDSMVERYHDLYCKLASRRKVSLEGDKRDYVRHLWNL